jgi:hypothetical protein
MGAGVQPPFDARKVADYVAHFDDANEAEATAYFRKVRGVAGKAGLKFDELVESEEYKAAVWEKFGGCATPCRNGTCDHGPESLRGWFQKKHGGGADLIAAQKLVEQLKKASAVLAAEVKRQAAMIANLQASAAAGGAGLGSSSGAKAGPVRGAVGGLFSLAVVMGAAALVAVVCRLAAAMLGGG